jgi:hypothetical protein
LEEGILQAFDSKLLGFMACVQLKDEFVFLKPIEGIDLTEWHTYTILWEPENATFLIDDVVVATTDEVPQVGMNVHLNWWAGTNLTLHCHTEGQEEICTDEYMQVDYIRVFTDEERIQEMDTEISGLLFRTSSLIEDLEGKGGNSTQLRSWHAEAREAWQKNHLYWSSRNLLQTIIEVTENWDEVVEMFSQANATIQEAEQLGADARTITIMKGYYSQAESRWREYDYKRTKTFLQQILDMPEPALLCILGLILLPTLLRRRLASVRQSIRGRQGSANEGAFSPSRG